MPSPSRSLRDVLLLILAALLIVLGLSHYLPKVRTMRCFEALKEQYIATQRPILVPPGQCKGVPVETPWQMR